MEDIPVMPIVRELFDTLPDWDVPEITFLKSGVQFFRDGYQVVVVRNRVATRYYAEFVRPRRYEGGAVRGPYVPTVRKPAAEVEAEYGMQPGSLDKAGQCTPADAEDIPDYEITDYLWQTLPRERRNTGGYWRDDKIIYYQLFGMKYVQKYRPKIIPDPVANAQDGTDVVATAEELPTYNFEDPSLWGGLPRSRPVTGGYWRDENYVYYQGLKDTEILKFRPTFDQVPF